MNDYNTVHYVLPECTEMIFCIPPLERDFSLKLLEGTVEVQAGCRSINLPLRQEYQLSGFQCSILMLWSLSRCNFIFRGDHYVTSAKVKIGDIRRNLLGVNLKGDSFVFVLENSVQLQIFVGDRNSRVKVEAMRGSPEIFGSSLIRNKKYTLIPNSSVLVNSLAYDIYTVGVDGKNRRIKVSLLQEKSFTFMKYVHARLHNLRIKALKDNSVGPVVLVIGSQNAGKTSFCQFLLNKAVGDGMNPVHIDLDVCRNPNVIPGAISLTEIKSQHRVTKGYSNYMQNILQFGSYYIHCNNIEFYYRLIRRMGGLMRECQTGNTTDYSGAVIDMCGLLGKDNSTIQCVLNSFKIDLVIFIGDRSSYDVLKNTILKTIQSHFIPQPENIEPQDQTKEIKLRDTILRKYFYGKISKPLEPNVFQLNILDIKIYRTVIRSSNDSEMYADISYFDLEPVACVPAIEHFVLGVSQAENVDEYSPTAEIQYFVCFTKVDMIQKTVSVLSPESVPFSEILIIGEIRMPLD